ncbi:hypothetical protein AQUCO_08600054v1 [Aquilegia coerulea]|uniref:Uncharacterized protein n=1 Tax=Aquilegia coerulea TaxID=218851 RepID=A0A2G5C6J9_AQUCA|nr:hypothetical protein AQUCO_08600054v1 [Aquilegia coerulea]
MVGWQRNLQTIIRHVGKRVEHKFSTLSSAHINSSSPLGQSCYPCNTYSCTKIVHPIHQYLQQLGISTSRTLLTDSADAIPSPLTPVLSIEGGKTEKQAGGS